LRADANRCAACQGKLSWFARFGGRRFCRSCRAKARRYYSTLLAALIARRADPVPSRTRLRALATQAEFSGKEILRLKLVACSELITIVLDQHPVFLSEKEEAQSGLSEIEEALDFDLADAAKLIPSLGSSARDFAELGCKISVARANAGRLETISTTKIFLKKDESVHFEVQASLLKEASHTVRTYAGISHRFAKGTFLHVGQSYPSVYKSIDTVDTGTLTITSQRIVYTGQNRSLEIPYNKLLAARIFSDGIEFNQSNRVNAALFKFGMSCVAPVVAAIINVAVQRQSNHN